MQPLAILYEHPRWFRPLFAELDRQEVPYRRLDVSSHRFDPGEADVGFSLVFNRVSPSAHTRGNGAAVGHALAYLEHLERRGVRVVDGLEAFRTEISKARQLALLEGLGLAYPAARVVNHPSEVAVAAEDLRFPVLVKANRGGSGAGIRRFHSPRELAGAAAAGGLELGPDGTALVQELSPPRGGHIRRVEVLGGRFLYAIRVHLGGADDTFNLCPASITCTADGRPLETEVGEGRETGLRVEAFRPPGAVVREVEAVAEAAGMEVGGVEYLVDDRDGCRRYFDINANSNFVAEPERVVGFDPHRRLVAWLAEEACAAGARPGDGRLAERNGASPGAEARGTPGEERNADRTAVG